MAHSMPRYGIAALLAFAILLTQMTSVFAADGAAANSPATNSSAVQPLTVDSALGELLDNAAARAVLSRQVPAVVSSPQISQARTFSLRSIQKFAPSLLTDERLRAIDEELARTPAAVSSPHAAKPAPIAADFHAALELRTLPLWDGAAPDAHGDAVQDRPTLTLIGTDGTVATGTAIIVAPGGGYQGLATGLEGRQVGDWFAAHGVAAFVLTYRLASFEYRHPAQLHDAQRAIRWVRAHAAELGIDPQRIGMIGFSAGGHLTAMASTLFDNGAASAVDPIDRVSSRPDFAVLAYPAILVDKSWRGWLGLANEKSTAKTKRELAPVGNVTAQTPPTFIFQTSNDELVAPANAIAYYNALIAAKVPAEMHIFEQGRHGMGLGMTNPALSVWPTLLQNWMEVHGLFGVHENFATAK